MRSVSVWAAIASSAAILLPACSSGKTFSTSNDSRQLQNADGADTGAGGTDATSNEKGGAGGVSTDESTGDADGTLDAGTTVGEQGAALTAAFSYGPKSGKADFLFVFDNSGSMGSILESVAQGFEGLASAKWPADSRIAVMTTLPGDPSDLSKVHPDVSEYVGIESEPGFLNFISAAAVKAFGTASPMASLEKTYPLAVCENAWFLPQDKNPAGVPCLRAAFQSPFFGVGAEAGLTAVFQLAQRRPGAFRSGAQVNVVFVSDTQDPGKGSADLLALRPNFSKIDEALRKNSPITSVKIHGVVPGEGCRTGEGTASAMSERGMPYQDAIRASGGVWLNLCEGQGVRTDYKPVAEQIIKGSLPDPVFTLSQAAAKVTAISVSGAPRPVADATLESDGRRVRISGLAPESDVKVEISFVAK